MIDPEAADDRSDVVGRPDLFVVFQEDEFVRLHKSSFRRISRGGVCFVIFHDLVFQAVVIDPAGFPGKRTIHFFEAGDSVLPLVKLTLGGKTNL